MTKPRDLAVVGAGVFGLSLARAAVARGLSVVVIEERAVGAGASGGVLGALMPHMPARWNAKKAFQFEALTTLAGHVAALEAETGLATGYRRCGRVMPIATADRRAHHLERAEESRLRWRTDETGYAYRVEEAGAHARWLAPETAPFGVVVETLAARVSPRCYLAALAASVGARAEILVGRAFAGFDEAAGRVRLADGTTLAARSLALANGYRAFAAIEALSESRSETLSEALDGRGIGAGEKGQALLLEGGGLEAMPAVYCDGLYVVPHDDGTVAVGSTADADLSDPRPDPAQTAALLSRARAFCPALEGCALLEAWAGIRPKPAARDPLVGLLPGCRQVFAATGGFKIGFAIAHLVADALAAEIAGEAARVALPPSFRPAHHVG
ncbi:NAD(P)/FAD-dependent oxidoreductase [Polymorphum gilvum]|uniref:FAD dependent oxidoreductase, putative n=1 Tax=Polymorphum gilvum (strain LMG 25793 / CGMCC 1.9160 / SL003B-26A1) TaxID=991905 RepID=F2IW71_POLGS|nr:FAD-dependent oxidoreductase [Polymorphum gilvum]ADZ71456.1 FAD dependent oxidoreductase, putative [Polymorphum gilvum SL003B-26A1]